MFFDLGRKVQGLQPRALDVGFRALWEEFKLRASDVEHSCPFELYHNHTRNLGPQDR